MFVLTTRVQYPSKFVAFNEISFMLGHFEFFGHTLVIHSVKVSVNEQA